MSDVRLKLPDDLLAAELWQQLSTVYDPELGINLVDLGLVYRLDVHDGDVQVQMTLTTPGCPMTDSMAPAVERALSLVAGVARVSVDLVWEPPWAPEMMSDRAKRELGWI